MLFHQLPPNWSPPPGEDALTKVGAAIIRRGTISRKDLILTYRFYILGNLMRFPAELRAREVGRISSPKVSFLFLSSIFKTIIPVQKFQSGSFRSCRASICRHEFHYLTLIKNGGHGGFSSSITDARPLILVKNLTCVFNQLNFRYKNEGGKVEPFYHSNHNSPRGFKSKRLKSKLGLDSCQTGIVFKLRCTGYSLQLLIRGNI